MKKENGQTKRVDNKRKDKTPTPYKKGTKYRQKRKSTSIYFLLWAVFSAFAFVILLALGFTQNFLFAQTYKREIAKDVNQKGDRIVADLYAALPSHQNWNIYVERLALRYGVHIVILDGEGKVLLPQTEGERNFQGDVITLKEKLAERQQNDVTYEGNGEYVFGAKLSALGESEAYVYVYRSLELLETVGAEMRLRTGLVSGFALVLAFAISSAVSGWLTRPIAEMTRSARRLAEGDFHVDFHGNDYGSELAELAEMLNFARDEISKTDTMQKELIANVSHDFKTPLTMIKAYSSMIKEISGNNPEKREKHAQVIIDEADRLTTLVGDVLDLSKLRSGIDALKMTEMDMSTTVSAILSKFSYLAVESGYAFETDVENDLYTRGDEVKLEQVLYNLIGNAVNYTGDDKKVFVRLKRTGENVFRFSVQDTGEGIAEEELAVIWDRYCRSATTHKRPVKGTGLGLSIVKTVLQLHGFAFGVDSEKGKGSTFWVDFPLI
jgi:signal transduction histidine kinase